MSMDPVTYDGAIAVARDLIGPEALAEGFVSEYCRGVCELIADCFGRPGVFLADRKVEVLDDLQRTEDYADELATLAGRVADRYPDDHEAQRVAEYAAQVVADHQATASC
jgi:hypothetical protein